MMSILPQASIAVWTSLSGAPSAVRSPPKTVVSPLISDAACSARSESRSLMTTLAPCSDSSSAVARPMPRAEPVTIATLSSRTPIPRTISGPLQPVGPADHVEHDLVGPGADPVQPQVAPGPLDLVLTHVTGAAEDLQALVGHRAAHLGGVQLGHRDLAHGVLAVGEAPGGGVDELTRGFDLGRHRRELVADDLEVADLAPERLALERVGERAVEGALCARDAARGADEALALELPHDLVEALADLPEDGVGGNAHVVEGQQRGVRRVHAELLQALLADHPGQVHV